MRPMGRDQTNGAGSGVWNGASEEWGEVKLRSKGQGHQDQAAGDAEIGVWPGAAGGGVSWACGRYDQVEGARTIESNGGGSRWVKVRGSMRGSGQSQPGVSYGSFEHDQVWQDRTS